MKEIIKQNAVKVALSIIATAGTVSAGWAYKKSQEQSLFEQAATLLEFTSKSNDSPIVTTKQKQEALLKIFYYAGYFEPKKVWQDIQGVGISNPEKTFYGIMKSVTKASVPEGFDPKILRKNLFNDSDLSKSDALDYLLYIGQSAFARNQNQERNELNKENWMDIHKDEYFGAAKTLGLVDQRLPQHDSYIESWIAGASRVGVLARLIDINYLLDKKLLKTTGKTLILAGQRPLWAEIDGISPALLKQMESAISKNISVEGMGDVSKFIEEKSKLVQEGREYMQELATKSRIQLDSINPFIVYEKEDVNMPKGLFVGRTYPNYLDINDGYLSETLMSYDLLTKYLSDKISIGVIDTKTGSNGSRPDTATTANDAARSLIESIVASHKSDNNTKLEYHVSFHSNQPYIERQTLTAQREVDKELKKRKLSDVKVTLDGVGFSAKEQDVAKIHSELGALFLERYKNIAESDAEIIFSRNLGDLTYRTRSKTPTDIPTPDCNYDQEFGLIGSMQNYFDYYLE